LAFAHVEIVPQLDVAPDPLTAAQDGVDKSDADSGEQKEYRLAAFGGVSLRTSHESERIPAAVTVPQQLEGAALR